MRKKALVSRISDKTGLPKTKVKDVLDAFTEVVTEELRNGGTVLLTGFGKFVVRKRSARKGRNPRTQEVIEIPEHNLAAFVPGKNLKETVW